MSVFDKHLRNATFQNEILKLETLEDKIKFCKEFLALNGIVDKIPKTEMLPPPIKYPPMYPNTDIIAVSRTALGTDNDVKEFIQRELAFEIGLACIKHIEFTSQIDVLNYTTLHRARLEVVKKK